VRAAEGKRGKLLPALAGLGAQAGEASVRDAVQRVALANRHYGYLRVTAQLRHEGVVVNHKRVLHLMAADNLLCLRRRPFVPKTTQSAHAWPVVEREQRL